MSRFSLELKELEILGGTTSHLYWAVKDNESEYPDEPYKYEFQGGASDGNGGIKLVGSPIDDVVLVTKDIENANQKDIKSHSSYTVAGLESQEDVQNIVKIMEVISEEIDNLDKKYGITDDNSNSVAYLVARVLGLNGGQLRYLGNELSDDNLFGAPGFSDDLLDNSSVSGFINDVKAKLNTSFIAFNNKLVNINNKKLA